MKLSVSAYRAGSAGTERIYSGPSNSNFGEPSTPPKPTMTRLVQEGLLKPILTPIPSQASVSCGLMTSAESICDKAADQESEKKEENNQTASDPAEKNSESSEGLPKQSSSMASNARRNWQKIRCSFHVYNSLRQKRRTRSNQRWMKLRTTVQLTGAITASKKASLKREDSFLKRFSTRQVPEVQDTFDNEDDGENPPSPETQQRRRRKRKKHRRSVINPDGNLYFYWLGILSAFVLYYLWALIVRQAFPELQEGYRLTWLVLDTLGDVIYILDLLLQFRTGYLEQGLIVEDTKKLAVHYMKSQAFLLDVFSIIPLNLIPIERMAMLRFPKMVKVYRVYKYYYIVESRTVYPNIWRVLNLVHILLLLAHWFGCFYYLISEAEGFRGDWAYPYHHEDDAYRTLTRKYLGSVYWSTLTLTTIGDLPTPYSNSQYVFTIASYLIGVFIFATIVGQVGNVITNRNASRLEFERLLDSAKLYMRHHKVPRDMQRRVQRWYDYSWSRGRIQGGGDISSALRVLPDKLKTELALHVNLSTLKKVSIFQECQPEFLHDLVLKMRASIFTPGDMICRRGEVAREMFIIADGILEVISETGKVLTTMKAGDFFGEIGILNLDGLNKRTADVRSVGYSELFSLSREDVLGAMKDYPEARELLQSMGKKRLAEAKRIANQHKKKVEAKNSGNKLLNDVRVIKDAITKSKMFSIRKMQSERSPVRSNETLNREASPRKRKRRFLRRMPRVSSDEDSAPCKPRRTALSIPTMRRDSSEEQEVIGAGLPLLQRLKLLKEKQDREERMKKEEMGNEQEKAELHEEEEKGKTLKANSETEPKAEMNEVIGAGLPLAQRLRLLKQKEELEAKNQEEKKVVVEDTAKAVNHSKAVETPLKAAPKGAAWGKVAQMMKPTDCMTSDKQSEAPVRALAKAAAWGKVAQVMKTGEKSDEKSDLSSSEKLPKATSSGAVAQDGKSETTSVKTSLEAPALSKSESDLITQRSESIEKDKGKWESIADAVKQEPRLVKEVLPKIYKSKGLSVFKPKTNSVKEKQKPKDRLKVKKHVSIKESPTSPRRIASLEHEPEAPRSPRSRLASDPTSIPATPKLRARPRDLTIGDSRMYLSVDDLSPEFTVLPFVKRLKILNERQKLAELESMVKTVRSKSVDFLQQKEFSGVQQVGGSLESVFDQEASNSGLQSIPRMPSSYTDPNMADSSNWVPTFLNMMMSALQGQPAPSLEKLEKAKNVFIEHINQPKINEVIESPNPIFPSISQDNAVVDELPLSPEGNETLERRSLKSILKRLSSKDLSEQLAQCGISGRKLLRSQTVEGYAARHSMFSKTVAFQQETLPSPPHDSEEDQKRSVSAPPVFFEDIPLCSETLTGLKSPDAQLAVDTSAKYQLKKKEQNNPLSTFLNNLVDRQADDRLSDMLMGLKEIIQSRMDDLEIRFQEKLNSLQKEIQDKDEVIMELENKLVEANSNKNEEIETLEEQEAEELRPIRRQCSVVTSYSSDMGDDDCEVFDEDDDERENFLVRGESCDSIIYRSSSQSHLADIDETECCPSSWDEFSEEEFEESRALPPALLPLSVPDQPEKRRDTVIQIDSDEELDYDVIPSSDEEEDEPLGENWEMALLAKELAKKEERRDSKTKIERLKRKALSGENLTESESNLLERILVSKQREKIKCSEKSKSFDDPGVRNFERSCVSRFKQSIPESKSLSPSTIRSFQKVKRTESMDRSSRRGIIQRFMSIDSTSEPTPKPPSALLKFRRTLKRSMTSSISKLTDILEDEPTPTKRSLSSQQINRKRRESVEMRELPSGNSRPVSEFEPLLGLRRRQL